MGTRLLAVLATVTATVAVMSGTAYAAPAPTYWQGTYGTSPFYGRQIVRDSSANFCAAPAFPLNLLVSVTGSVCYAQSLSPADTAGGDFIAEYAICVGDGSKDYTAQFGNWENAFEIYDDTAGGVVVREWTEPSTYAAHDFTLHGGDCATWLWNIPMVTDAGTPLASGHTHHVIFHNGTGPEQSSAYFTAP